MPWLSTLPWTTFEHTLRGAVRWVSVHTGVPALLVGAIAVVIGYRILKKSARFLLEVFVVAALLVAATLGGCLRW